MKVITRIELPVSPEVAFDMARSVGLHLQSTGGTNEKVIEPVDKDLLGLGDIVTFEAVHVGFRRRLTSKIVQFDSPNQFTDEMQKGVFRWMRHAHRFDLRPNGCEMTDILEFGFLPIVDQVIVGPYMRNFLLKRGEVLRQIALEKVPPYFP